MVGIICDLHIHSTFSDGSLTIPELVDFYGKRGFGAIAITDHLCEAQPLIGKAARILNQTLTPEIFPLYLEIIQSEAARALDQYNMIVIPGFEISKNSTSNHRSAHMIGLDINEFIHADGDVYEIAKKIKMIGGTTIAAHPVHTKVLEKQTYHLWSRRREMSLVIDAWEATRHNHLLEQVLEEKVPIIANSDFHRPAHICSWKTVVRTERKKEAILEAIKNQEIEFFKFKEDV